MIRSSSAIAARNDIAEEFDAQLEVYGGFLSNLRGRQMITLKLLRPNQRDSIEARLVASGWARNNKGLARMVMASGTRRFEKDGMCITVHHTERVGILGPDMSQ